MPGSVWPETFGFLFLPLLWFTGRQGGVALRWVRVIPLLAVAWRLLVLTGGISWR